MLLLVPVDLVTISTDGDPAASTICCTRLDAPKERRTRGPVYPDPQADQGRHVFRVTVRPNAAIADAVEEGYRTNLPVRTVEGGAAVAPLVTVSNPAIVVEAVLLAGDGSGDVVVRLYESLGGRASGTLTADFPVTGVAFTDLLERPLHAGPGTPTATGVELTLRPFQIATVRLSR